MHCRVHVLLCIRAWVKACQCRQCTALLRELPVATELCLRWVWPYQWLRLLSHWFPGLLPALRSLGWAVEGGGGGVLEVWCGGGDIACPLLRPMSFLSMFAFFPIILYSLLVIYSLYTCIPTLYGWYFSHFLWPLLPALQLYPCWLSHKEDLRSPVLYQALRLGCSMLAAAIAYRPHIR
jgi:hypothetical protein